MLTSMCGNMEAKRAIYFHNSLARTCHIGDALLASNHKEIGKCKYNMKWNGKEPEIAIEVQ